MKKPTKKRRSIVEQVIRLRAANDRMEKRLAIEKANRETLAETWRTAFAPPIRTAEELAGPH